MTRFEHEVLMVLYWILSYVGTANDKMAGWFIGYMALFCVLFHSIFLVKKAFFENE
jgi:hypothetical protein